MERDRNLLFGVLAVQLGRATPQQSAVAGALWTANPSRSLGDYFVESNALDDADRRFIDNVLDDAIRAADGNATSALESLGGKSQVDESFLGSLVFTESGHICSTIPHLPLGKVRVPSKVLGVQESPGRYSQIGEYGRGGMGRVLLVHDEHLGRQIALKELLPGSDSQDNAHTQGRLTEPMMARFLQEARITGQLEHPSIVPVYELGHRADGSLYYTMKLVRGKTLSQAIADAGSVEGRLKLLPHFIDLCNAIAYAHSRKVIHRDIKPGNVMVGDFGETVALDWGLAKSKEAEDLHAGDIAESLNAIRLGDEASLEKTTHGQAIGTPTYMPPEQALGQLELVDERSDVYALGAVLYELLSTRPPYSGKESREILAKVVSEDPEELTQVSSRIPAELVAICKKAMARAPGDRYQTAKELAEEVQRFQTGGFVSAHAYRVSDLVRWFVRKYKPIVVTSALAAVALLALGVYSYENNRSAKIIEHGLRVESQARLYTASINLSERHIEDAKLEVAGTTLDRCPSSLRNWEWGRLRYVCNATSTLLTEFPDDAFDAAFSPDGTRLLMIGAEGDVVLWDVSSARVLLRVDAGKNEVPSVAFGLRGDEFATSGDDASVKIWDAATGSLKKTLVGHDGEVRSVCYTPDGEHVISGAIDGTVRIWDIASGEAVRVLDLGEVEVQCVAVDAAGARCAAACSDGRVVVFDESEGLPLLELQAHPTNLHIGISGAIKIAFRPGHNQLASCGCDDTAKLWDLETGELLQTMRGHVQKLWSVTFTSDGATLTTASGDREVKFWNPDTGQEKMNAIGTGVFLARAVYSPDNTRLVTLGSATEARIWDVREPFGAYRLHGHSADVNAVAFSPDNRLVASGAGHWAAGWDSRVILWDTASRGAVNTLEGHSGPVYCVAFHPEGRWVTSAGADHRIITWDVGSGAVVREFSADVHSNGVRSIAYSPDGRRLLSGGWDAEGDTTAVAVIWDAAAGTPIHTLEGHGHVIDSVDWSRDGLRVATACRDGVARVWDPATGALVSSFALDEGWVYAVAFDPRGGRLATAHDSGALQIWDLATGNPVLRMNGHTIRVNKVRYSANGTRLVSCDNTGVNVWDPDSGDLLLTLPHDTQDIAFSRDTMMLATAGMDGDVILWPALPWK